MYIVHVNAIEIRIHDSDDNYYLDGESPFSPDCSHIMKTGQWPDRWEGGGEQLKSRQYSDNNSPCYDQKCKDFSP